MFVVILKFLSSEVCASVTWFDETLIVNSCASPTINPVSSSIVNAPVVVSAASALKKFPPAITVPEVLVTLPGMGIDPGTYDETLWKK